VRGLGDSWVHDTLGLWLLIGVLVLIAFGALWTDVRRGNISKRDYVTLVVVLAWSLLSHPLASSIQARFAQLPPTTQTAITSRLHLAVFLFWLAVFGFGWLAGFAALVHSSAIFGYVHLHHVARRFVPFSGEFYRLIQRSSDLSRSRRALVFLHHGAFSLAILCAATAGLLMTFGFPRWPLWLYLVLFALAALLLNPARSDARMMGRLFAAREPSAHTA